MREGGRGREGERKGEGKEGREGGINAVEAL